MSEEKVILITGVASIWGERVATRLLAQSRMRVESVEAGDSHDGEAGIHVIGVDVEPPAEEIEGLDFIQVDVRNPLFSELLKSEMVDTVCHLNFDHKYYRSEKAFDFNVLGTMKVIGACSEAGVKKIILKSSTAVYGAHPGNPAFLTEQHPLRGSKTYGYTRDMVEIASFCNGYCSQPTEMGITILRFPSIIGPSADTPMMRYLNQRAVPKLMGFDPMMQIIHESDVVEALVKTIEEDIPGIYNVAADGVLPLQRLIGLAGKISMPVIHPIAYIATNVMSGARLPLERIAPIEWDYLRYTWVADLTRMHNEMDFSPKYTALEILREFNSVQKINRYKGDTMKLYSDDEYLRFIIESRSRIREQEMNENEDVDNE